jgi:hypothetical protein
VKNKDEMHFRKQCFGRFIGLSIHFEEGPAKGKQIFHTTFGQNNSDKILFLLGKPKRERITLTEVCLYVNSHKLQRLSFMMSLTTRRHYFLNIRIMFSTKERSKRYILTTEVFNER